MKKIFFKRSFIAASMLLMTVAAIAQSSTSAYFLEGYNQRYQMNPAFAPERHVFMAVPVISNFQFDAQSTVGLSNFLYKRTPRTDFL